MLILVGNKVLDGRSVGEKADSGAKTAISYLQKLESLLSLPLPAPAQYEQLTVDSLG